MNRIGTESAEHTDEDRVGTLSFTPTSNGDGVTILDPIERQRYSVETSSPVSPTPHSTDSFLFPADAGVAITTETLTLPTVVAVYIRNQMGEMLAEAEHFAYQEFPAGVYSVELCAPIKLYFQVHSSLLVASDAEQTRFEFGEETEVLLGARSHHERPAATITTTTDPADMMAAVSTFGSALKTTSCERSYPSLRGHPPTVELGDRLDIPDSLETPETGIQIEIPPTYHAIYVAAPLAYYLGATLAEGENPRIITDTGFEHSLATGRGFEREVERVLKQTFFLDCLTRTEGYYQVDLHQRQVIESKVDLDFATLYTQSLADQLESYLTVPYALLEDEIPDWKLTSYVEPTPTSIESLPFIVEDLAIVHTPQTRSTEQPEETEEADAVDEFFRTQPAADTESFTRSTSQSASTEETYVQPASTDSVEETWIGEGTPIGASKVTTTAFQNHLNRSPVEGDIDITVICNDEEMTEEIDAVDAGYGSREELPFDVTVHHELTTDELREVLTTETDFLHYIGHIDQQGFECIDGKFDATTLETVGVDAFLLNACQSYKQGMQLLEAGSIGGVVTLSDVLNSGAVRIGRTMARLLNAGFPLRAALTIARDESIVGSQYIVVGDGGLSIAQSESGAPTLCEVDSTGDLYQVQVKTYPTSKSGMGSLVVPHIESNQKHFLNSGVDTEYELTKNELIRYLSLEEMPVRIDGALQWSGQLDVSDL